MEPSARLLQSLADLRTQGCPFMRRADLLPWVDNPRFNAHAVPGVVALMNRFGWTQPILVRRDNREIIAGHTRTGAAEALGLEEVPVLWLDLVPDEAHLYALADNRRTELTPWTATLPEILQRYGQEDVQLAGWADADTLGRPPDMPPLPVLPDAGAQQRRQDVAQARITLAERFGVPPFTVLDARQGYWQERKRAWNALGLRPEAGREQVPDTSNRSNGQPGFEYMSGRGGATGGSGFDPVLCEIAYRWFCPPGGSVLDPFAGEATKGIVAAYLQHPYTGIEVRQEQVDANVAQAQRVGVEPCWVCGDSARLHEYLPTHATYDLVWTSPPYFDLEVYSRDPKDGSTAQTYEAFMQWYAGIFAQAVQRLRPNRFLGVKVGDVRDDVGAYRDFVGDNVRLFRRLGLAYYNEAILVTPVGSLPIRAAHQFPAGRKLAKAHQNVLLFYKGDPRQIGKHFPKEVEAGAALPSEEDQG